MGVLAYRQGLAALASGRPEAALAPLRAAIGDPVQGAWARLNLGLALQALGRLADAEPHLAAAAALLTDQAEYGGWELTRLRRYRDGTRDVWIRRKIIRVVGGSGRYGTTQVSRAGSAE